ncbi:hypothetical protein [Aequorivita echinoideorum]|uniref:Uncharacterized protein n=1 Tax=Aequorivita echinoideorum TaxID=1549647 RepID=A0ABS5S704_9FLAO|nr:hypothetical protein [Aequorivita echinoideorum]MBT0608991.1 hypothetical protein [Aequorivita echinoideorum]
MHISNFVSFPNRALLFFSSALMLFGLTVSSAQNGVEISIVKKSDKPKTESVHSYTLEIKNTSNRPATYTLRAQNVNCENSPVGQSNLAVSLLDATKASPTNQVRLDAGQTKQVILQTSRSADTRLNTFSCVEIFAENEGNRSQQASVVMRQMVPDPNTFE